MHRAVRTPSTRLSLPSRALAGHRPCTCEGATSGRPGTRGVNQSTALQSLRHLSRSVDSLTPHIPCHWPILYRAPVLGGMRVCGTLSGTGCLGGCSSLSAVCAPEVVAGWSTTGTRSVPGRRAAPMRRSRVRPRNRCGGPSNGSMGSDMVRGDRSGGLDVRSSRDTATPPPPRTKAAARRRPDVEASGRSINDMLWL